VDGERQWFKSKFGLTAEETSRDVAFCAHAILQDEVFVVEDASLDPRFHDNPLVQGGPQIRFYAGAPLLSPEGFPIGTVCVIDSNPRSLNAAQLAALKALSNQVTRLLELKAKIKKLEVIEEKMVYKSTAIANIAEGVALQDATGAMIEFNEAALKVLDLTSDQLTGKSSMDPAWQAIREDGSELKGIDHPSMVSLRTGQKQNNVIMGVQTPSKGLRWLSINAVPVFEHGSTSPTHTVVSFADITSQREEQVRIKKSHEELRFILDSIPHMIGYWSTDLINLNANREYAAYFGRTQDDIQSLHINDLFGAAFLIDNQKYIDQVLAGQAVSYETSVLHADGTIHHTLRMYTPNIIQGQVTSFLAIAMDVTSLKQLEDDRRKLEVRLAEAARLSTLGEMAAGVAHEINNPLAIIRGKAGILKRKMEMNKFEIAAAIKELAVIESTVDRIAKIVKGLKTYSRNAENDPFDKVKVASLLDDTLELCKERLKFGLMDIRVQCDPGFQMECRAAQISQVLMNLLGNAFDANEENPEKWIDIKVTQKSEMIEILIKDSGHGIEPSIVTKMMQPFFTTKGVGKGTGLGLSISVGIAESHGGSLRYLPNEKNTTFVLTIPVTQAAQKPAAA